MFPARYALSAKWRYVCKSSACTGCGTVNDALLLERSGGQREYLIVGGTPEQFQGFLWSNVIKYTLRCGSKDAPVKEMQKAQQYARWYVQACEGKTIDPRE